MRKLPTIICFQLFFCFGYLPAQNNNLVNNVDEVLSEYVQKIIEEKDDQQNVLKKIAPKNSNDSHSPDNIELLKLFLKLDLGYCSLIEKKDLEKYERTILNAGFTIDEFYSIYIRYYSVITRHKSLISDGIINKDDTWTYQAFGRLVELAFYGIETGEVVAEVGAGVGYDIELLTRLYPENEFIVSENDPKIFPVLQQTAQDNNNVNVIEGDHISCGLEEMEIDIIILRNVFHRIENKEAFLFSILESVNKDGQIIILEHFKENELPDNCCCFYRIQKSDFNTLIEIANLKLVDHKILHSGGEIFKFELD